MCFSPFFESSGRVAAQRTLDWLGGVPLGVFGRTAVIPCSSQKRVAERRDRGPTPVAGIGQPRRTPAVIDDNLTLRHDLRSSVLVPGF
jgi:hypothetical protein